MTFRKTVDRYHLASISLHWLMLALFIGVYASINLRELFDKGSVPREALKSLHFMLGLFMFALVWLRLAMRAIYPAPRLQAALPQWQAMAGKLAHLMLYAIMIGMPLLGWLMLSAAGKPIPFFGLELPALIGPDKALAAQLKEIHEFVGTAGYFLIGGHAAAALFHHYVQRDNTLLRMWPGSRKLAT
ncbi:cytochrome b [Rhodoferax ferrireducens]|uniref:cytochrome b n=1 Tax=Rhodoferax ferrireducens TaxID=192843 RepID=UPI003BB6D888